MRKYFLPLCVACSSFGCGQAEPPTSLKQALSHTTSRSASERIRALQFLGEHWDRSDRGQTGGFSDTPVEGETPKQKSPISNADVDAIASAIEQGLKDEDANVREAAAIAITTAPRSSDAVLSAVETGIKSDDPTVNWYVSQQARRTPPKMEKVIDALIESLSSDDFSKYYSATDLLGSYGPSARPYSKSAVDAILRSGSRGRSSKMYVLYDMGLTEDAANALTDAASKFSVDELGVAAVCLLEYPDQLQQIHSKRPELIGALGDHRARLFPFLCRNQHKANPTRDWLASAEGLPANIMGMLGDSKFLDELTAYERKADKYEKKFLAACKRACGGSVSETIQIDSATPVAFRPASAWPNTDGRRRSKTADGHSDGLTPIMITGEILEAGGGHPEAVEFYRVNDGMLLGTKQNARSPVMYNRESGRFIFMTTVFAAYCTGKDQPEPGPYQTGSAQIRIEATGLDPLTVQFFDEMPDVRITLSKVK